MVASSGAVGTDPAAPVVAAGASRDLVEKLLGTANGAAAAARAGWVGFLGLATYLLITVASTGHVDLLLNKPVRLPIVGIDLPLTSFYGYAPALLVMAHLGLLMQHLVTARKLKELDLALAALAPAPDLETYRAGVRSRLSPYVFCQSMIGHYRRRSAVGWLMRGMIWTSLILLPLAALFAFLVQFLPFHDMSRLFDDVAGLVPESWHMPGPEEGGDRLADAVVPTPYSWIGITWQHRLWLILDVLALLFIWPAVATGEATFWQALRRSRPLLLLLGVVNGVVLVQVAVFIVTVPEEGSERVAIDWCVAVMGEDSCALVVRDGRIIPLSTVSLFEGEVLPQTLAPSSLFARNLVIVEKDLVAERSSWHAGEVSHVLRGRDLRYANLRGTDLKHASFDYALLQGADLGGADLRGATFSHAGLKRARLEGANLSGADLTVVDLEAADLGSANLQAADLESARLQGATLRAANLLGAGVQNANLQGADLSFASLQAADLSLSDLTAASLEGANLQATDLSFANLRGADLSSSDLQGTTLSFANLRGADVSHAYIWQTDYPFSDSDLELATVGPLSLMPPTPEERLSIAERLAATVSDPGLRERVLEQMAPLLSNPPPPWPDQDTWLGASRWSVPAADLAAYLVQLACLDESGYVARGLLRRLDPVAPFGMSQEVKTTLAGALPRLFATDFTARDAADCPGRLALDPAALEVLAIARGD